MHAEVPMSAESGFENLAKLWRRRRWLGVSVFLLSFAAAATFVLSLPDIYSATATVLVKPGPGDGTQAANAVEDTELDSVSEAVLSRSRLLGLVDRFDLYPEMRRTKSADAVLKRMRQDILLQRKPDDQRSELDPTFAFTLSYQGWNPQVVAQVTNTLATSFVDENNSMRLRQTSDTVNSLQAQLTDIKQKLDSQEQKINAFKDSHMGELPEQQAANLSTLQQLNTQLHENAESLASAMQRRETMLKQMTDSGDADLGQLELELASLRTRYTEAYPDVIRIKSQIAALKRSQTAQDAAPKPASPQQQQYQSLDSEIKSYRQEDERLRGQIAAYQGRVENVPLRAQQLQALTQGYNETQDVYSSLLKRYEQARLMQAPQGGNGGQYRVLEPAIAPIDAAGPARLRLLLMCLVLCLGLTAATVLVAEQLDTSFHSVDELRSFTRVQVLASIPKIVTRGDIWRQRLRTGTAIVSLLLALVVLTQASYFLGRGNERLVWMLSHHGSA